MLIAVAIGTLVAAFGVVLVGDSRGFRSSLAARYGRLTGVRSAAYVMPLRLMGVFLIVFGLLIAVLALTNLG